MPESKSMTPFEALENLLRIRDNGGTLIERAQASYEMLMACAEDNEAVGLSPKEITMRTVAEMVEGLHHSQERMVSETQKCLDVLDENTRELASATGESVGNLRVDLDEAGEQIDRLQATVDEMEADLDDAHVRIDQLTELVTNLGNQVLALEQRTNPESVLEETRRAMKEAMKSPPTTLPRYR